MGGDSGEEAQRAFMVGVEEAQTQKSNLFVRIEEKKHKYQRIHQDLNKHPPRIFHVGGRKLNTPLWWEWRKLKEKNHKYLSAYIRIEINNSHELSILWSYDGQTLTLVNHDCQDLNIYLKILVIKQNLQLTNEPRLKWVDPWRSWTRPNNGCGGSFRGEQ